MSASFHESNSDATSRGPRPELGFKTCFDPGDLAAWTGGKWIGTPPAVLQGIGHDTRADLRGSLYVALKGDRFDGHAFLTAARQAGARAAMVDSGTFESPSGWPLLRVGDTREALKAAAAAYRRTSKAVVLGLTGSVGKTTVKNLLSSMLALEGDSWSTRGNWNNDIGLPLSLLAMPPQTRRAVFELGASAPGDIRELCRIARPDAAIVTRIGPAHLAQFGSLAGIVAEKSELPRAVPAHGFVVLDKDDPFFPELAAAAGCEVITVSLEGAADFQGRALDSEQGLFRVETDGLADGLELRCGLPGRHNLGNALLALAAARRLGCGWDRIREALAAARSAPMRWNIEQRAGVTVINDAYNANPLSMSAALATFAEMCGVKRKWIVLGDMLEMGVDAPAAHRELGTRLAVNACHGAVLVGEFADQVREGAVQAGCDPARLWTVKDASAAATVLRRGLLAGDALLLKASRGVGLERIERDLWPETFEDRDFRGSDPKEADHDG